MTPESVLRELEGLRALALSLVQGGDDADDLIQDTAIAAIAHPPEEDRPVRPWLATVLKNRWRMNRRSEARRRVREEAATVVAEEAAADDPLDRARVLQEVSSALVALDEPYRSTVIARYLDGKSAAEIARTYGIPPGTVRWRLKTGLDRLRAALDRTSPRWHRALVPIAAAKGALFVKAKSIVIAVLALLLLIGGGALLIAKRDKGPATAPAGSGSARSGSGIAGGSAPAPKRSGEIAFAPIADPLPGQGRAKIEAVASAKGGVVAGRVINWSTGEGVSSAEMTFSGPAGAATIHTREDGAFELAPEAPGAFELTAVVAAGYLPYAPELAHSAVSLRLAKGQAVRGITVFLFPAVDYHGVVVDAANAPIAGAQVHLLGTPQGEQRIESLATEWTTDKDGGFTFHAADDAVLEATHGKFRGWSRLNGDVAITHQMKIVIAEAPARDAKISGVTIDDKGQPLPDVLVRADPEDAPGKDDARATAFATSGPDGTFVLDGLDKGGWRLGAELDGHAPVFEDAHGGDTGVKLVLDPGLPLSGVVRTTEGEPVPAYTLLVRIRAGALRPVLEAKSVVSPTGAFEVRVPKGDYELVASASGLAPSAPVAATAGASDIVLTVTAGAVVRGKVVSAAGGAPVRYARVMREGGAVGGPGASPANAGTVTREDGTFELTGMPPGPVSLMIAAGGFNPKIESGMTATDGADLGPLQVALNPIADGAAPQLELVGIGIKLAADKDSLVVQGVFPDSGAAAAGIVEGDRVTAVDGLPVAQLGLDGAIGKIRGQAGTTVAITLDRAGKQLQLVVERRKLHT